MRSTFRTSAVVAVPVVLVAILYESSQVHGSPGVPALTTNVAYAGHFAIYATLAFCGLAALGRPTWLGTAAVVLFSVGLGIAMEIYQIHVPTRTASVLDAMADTAGVMAGVFVFSVVMVLLEPLGKQSTKP